MSKSIVWNLGNQKAFTATEIGDKLTINGYKENDFIITLNEAGQLVLTDVNEGAIKISGWSQSTLKNIAFVADGYTKTLSKSAIKAQLFNVLTMSDNQSYSGGTDTHQEFDIVFSEATNITINSSSSTEDRIKFTNNWSVDNVDMQIIGNDFYIKNWSPEKLQVIDGQVAIKNFMNSSVKTIEFGEQTYHLITGGNSSFTGSDTIRDRYVFLDVSKSGSNVSAGDWNVTIDGGYNDVLDFRFLPGNLRYYSLNNTVDGRDMVLTYKYSVTPSGDSETLGTVRIKNYFNNDGTANTEYGNIRLRVNRQFYAGHFSSDAFDGLAWNQITGRSEDKSYRWLYLNTGTAAADEVDLADLVKPNANYGWLHYAGEGNDMVTAHKGDIVYGDAGNDTLYATGNISDIHGGAGTDRITVRGENGENISQVVVRGEGDNDVINAYGSYHAIFGNGGDDEIHLRSAAGDAELAHNSYAGGGSGIDKIYIHAGHDHRVSGSSGNDTLYAYLGDNHILNGGAGEDEIHIVDDGTKRSQSNRANGGADDDHLYIENGGQNHYLSGGDGDDYLSVDGDNNALDGGNGMDILTVVGGTGNSLTGGEGKDRFVFKSVSGGNTSVEDYSDDYDMIEIEGGKITKTELANDGNDVVFTVGTGTITVKNVADTNVSLNDSRGHYEVSGNYIELDKDFTGEMDAGAYLDTVVKVEGAASGNAVNIKGNAQANKLYGGSGANKLYGYDGDDELYGRDGNDYLYGGAGDDKLYGGAGNDKLSGGSGADYLSGGTGDDTLVGGAGKDTFVHYQTYENDTITDYTAGEDLIHIASGSISKTSLVNSGKDVKFAIGDGSVTVQNGAGKAISIKDGRGSYTASGTEIVLGTDFTGEMDAGAYLDTVVKVEGAASGNAVNIKGNAQANKLYGGAGTNKLYGYDGDDELYGRDGNDYLYGGTGDDKLTGGAGNDKLSGGSGADYLSGGTGDDTLVGGAGKDLFVHYQTYENDTITDYTAGEDLINIASGSISKTELVNNGKDVKFTIGTGSVTVQNGSGKSISLEDGRGSYTASGTEITLGKDFAGEMDAGAYLDTVVKVEGAASGNAVNIKGNAQANKLYGGAGTNKLYGYDGNDELYGREGNDYLYGGTGDDKLYGGAGNDKLSGGSGADYLSGGTGDDTLVGGAGKDTFVHYQTYENDTITDYTAGEDLINIASGSISKTELVNNGKDVKFTIGTGSVMVQNGSGKSISLEDGRGSYTASGTEITLGKDFAGEMDAGAYLDTVVKVEGAASGNAVNIKGNAQANKLYGGSGANKLYGYDGDDELYGRDGNDYLYGGAGNDKLSGGAGNDKLSGGSGADYLSGGTGDDTLVGGAGKDTFVHYQTYENDTITDYTAGEDLINIASGSISKTELVNNGKDVKFTIGTGSVMVQNGSGKSISLEDGRGSYTASGTEIVLGTDFTGTMDASAYLDSVTAIDGSAATNDVTLKGNGHANTIYGGSGNDVLNGGAGNDYLNGGTGSDTYIVNAVSSDTSVQIDQSSSDEGDADVLDLSSVNSSDVQFSLEDGALTIAHDNGGMVTVSGWSDNSLSKVIFADNTELTGAEITASATWIQSVVADNRTVNGGNGKDHLLVNGNDNTLNGHAGDDILEVLAGKDNTLTGGTGNDTYIVHWPLRSETTGCHNVTIENGSAGDGDVDNLVIKGASSGDFKIYISGGNNEDLVIQNNAPYNNSDYIVIHDWANHGFETVTFDDKTLTNEEIYAFLADQDHEIHMNQSMSYEAGQWKDVFIYDGTGLDTTITGYVAGEDKLKFTDQSISKVEASGNDALLTLTDGGTITVKNMVGQGIDYLDSSGELHSVTAHITQQSVIKNFMKSLDETVVVVASDALNTAVDFASYGLFPTWDSLIERFVSDVRNYGGTAEDGYGYDYATSADGVRIKVPDNATDTFLKTYCGIDLTNEDTGSITGADAGGPVVKTAESIMPPETGTLASAQYPVSDRVIGKLTIKWPEMETLSVTQKTIIAGLDTYWIDAALNLVEESYGITYPTDGNVSFIMNVNFFTGSGSGTLASASANSLNINTYYWDEMDSENINGVSTGTEFYFDRVMAHELTHAVMSASLYNYDNIVTKADGTRVRDGFALWNNLSREYSCVNEGLAELTHGIDDDRFDDICKLAQSTNADQLQTALTDSSDYYRYAGGYMLFRYLAKQTEENYHDTFSGSAVNMTANSVADSITSAASSLWSETTAAVADVGSELASSMVSVSNAMLTPLDSTDSNVFGSGSLSSDLFSDKQNKGFLG